MDTRLSGSQALRGGGCCLRCMPRRQRAACRLGHNKCVDTPLNPTLLDTDAQLPDWVAAMAAAGQARPQAERAWTQLYDCTVQRVHAMVRRFVHEDSAAQEVTEDVMYQAWVQAGRFDASRGNVMAWLLTMARSRALDAWRKHSAAVVSYDSEVAEAALAQKTHAITPVDLLSAMDRQHALHAALALVSPAARQMISLAFFQGLTHSEISAHMHTPVGTVKTTIRRALLSLREHLQTHQDADMAAGLSVLE